MKLTTDHVQCDTLLWSCCELNNVISTQNYGRLTDMVIK